MSIIVKVSKTATDDVMKYIRAIKQSSSKLEKALFDFDISFKITSSCTLFIAYDEKVIKGVIISKVVKINKKNYLDLPLIHADSSDIYKQLFDEVFGMFNESSAQGMFTSIIPEGSEIQKILKQQRFKIYDSVYGISSRLLEAKSSNKPSIYQVRFTSKTRSNYSRLFSDLLVEHDIQVNKEHNKAAGKEIYPVQLDSKQHRIVVSYFISGTLKKSNWYTYLFFTDEECSPENCIGFIKTDTDKDKLLCFPSIYLKPKYFDKYINTALHQFAENINEANVENTCVSVSREWSKLNHISHQLLGNPLGHSYIFV